MLFAVMLCSDLGKLQSISGILWCKWSVKGTHCASTRNLFILKQTFCDCLIPVWRYWACNAGKVGYQFDPHFHHIYISSVCIAILIVLLFGRTGGREEWTVKGDDPLLSLLFSCCLSLSSPLALSALQSPLSTLITYINMSKKKTALCVCVTKKEFDRVCVCVCMCVQLRRKLTTKQSNDCWVLV